MAVYPLALRLVAFLPLPAMMLPFLKRALKCKNKCQEIRYTTSSSSSSIMQGMSKVWKQFVHFFSHYNWWHHKSWMAKLDWWGCSFFWKERGPHVFEMNVSDIFSGACVVPNRQPHYLIRYALFWLWIQPDSFSGKHVQSRFKADESENISEPLQ